MAVRNGDGGRFGSVWWHAGRWHVHAEPHVMMRLRAVFPKLPQRPGTATIKDSPDVPLDLRWFMQRYPLFCWTPDRLERSCRDREESEEAVRSILLPDYEPQQRSLKVPLRRYQGVAVDLALARKRLLVADEVGLGKTAVAIGMIADPRARPAMVVTQTHLAVQWAEQVEKFSDLTWHIVRRSRPYAMPEADCYIFTYSKIRDAWIPFFEENRFASCTFDEMQELRRPESQKYRTCEHAAARAEFAIGTTMTPIYNYGGEIFTVLSLLEPGCLGSWPEFVREWTAGAYGQDHGRTRVSNPKALGSHLKAAGLMIRRTRRDVGRELPPVNRIVHNVGSDGRILQRVEERARILAETVVAGSFEASGAAARDLDSVMRRATGVAKAPYVAEYVTGLVEAGERVLLVGWHRDVYDVWRGAFRDLSVVWYTGTEDPLQKDRSRKTFLEGRADIMVMSLRSGVGLDGLQTACSVIVFGELDWSPAIADQCIGRLARDGQPDPVTAIFLISEEGSDPVMVDVLGLKRSEAAQITDPFAASGAAAGGDDPRLKRLARSVLDKARGRADGGGPGARLHSTEERRVGG